MNTYQTHLILAAMDALDGDITSLMLRKAIGPNEWNTVTAEDYSFSFDYIVEPHGNRTVIDPTSRAAQQWLYRYLPADCPRWGAHGYVIETENVMPILEHMQRDGLLSENEYAERMNEEDEQRRQWDNQ